MAEEVTQNAIPLEERMFALENQAYVMYLQLNAITKIMIDKEIVDKDLLTAEMDELNKQISEVAEEMNKQNAEAPAGE